MLILHNYFRSSTSFRVRAALNMKRLNYDSLSYALLKNEHQGPAHRALNPQMLVPTLETPTGPLTQSLAILEWLDEMHPTPPLLPADPWGRARVRSLAQIVALEVHPVNNLRILRQIRSQFGADEAAVADWFRHWASAGFDALEARLVAEPETGAFCHGDSPGLADLCLVAQVVNNARFDVPTAPYPTIMRIAEACLQRPEIAAAHPMQQPDAV